MINITAGKTYITRDGEKVRVYATDGQQKYPVHAAVYSINAEAWIVDQWTASGRAYNDQVEHGNDIIAEAKDDCGKDQIPLFDCAVLT